MKFRYSLTLTREERTALLELLNSELGDDRPSRKALQWARLERLITQLREKVLSAQ